MRRLRHLRWGQLRLRAQGVETFHCQNLLREDVAELACGFVRDGFETRAKSAVPGISFSRLVTGRSVIPHGLMSWKSREIGRDVEGEAVRSDAARNVNADGANLATPCGGQTFGRGQWRVMESAPDPGEAGDASGANSVNTAKTDERFFHLRTKSTGPRRDPVAFCRLRRSKMG